MPPSIPTRHHYLPQFYLGAWAAGGEAVEYSRPYRNVVTQRRSTKATGFEDHLYSLPGEADPLLREQVELTIFSKIDDTAAPVLRKMIDRPGQRLTPEETHAWIRFLKSMIFRTPARLAWMNEQIRTGDHKFTAEERAEYEALRSDDHPDRPEDYFAKSDDEELSSARMQLMLRMINSNLLGRGIAQMSWTVHKVDHLNHGLLTCDDPVMTSNGMNSGNSFVLLPVGPRHLFIAANSDRAMWSFTSQTDRAIERAMNDAMVAQAAKLVIGQTDRQREFVERRLGKSPPGPGFLGRHTWACP